jgi:hypothetical protein
MRGLPTARCKICARPMVRAWIPNRGWVMAHRHGERKYCDAIVRERERIAAKEAK